MKRIEILGESTIYEMEIVLSKDCQNYPIKNPYDFMRKFGETFPADSGRRMVERSVKSYSDFYNDGWHIVLRVREDEKQKLLNFIEGFNK